MSHSRTVVSYDADARIEASLLKHTAFTLPTWPPNLLTDSPEPTSQTNTVRSPPHDAKRVLSGVLRDVFVSASCHTQRLENQCGSDN